MDTHHLTRAEMEDRGAWTLNGRQIKKRAGDDADLVHAEWGTGDVGGGGEYYQCYVSAGGEGGGGGERGGEEGEGEGGGRMEDGVWKGMGGVRV